MLNTVLLTLAVHVDWIVYERVSRIAIGEMYV